MKNKKVLFGLSGGVDSAIALHFLKQKNYDIQAVFMLNWDDQINNAFEYDKQSYCVQQQDFQDAKWVAQKFNIPLKKINFIDEYWNKVFQKFLELLKKGYTPNPDVLCNRYIKFGIFAKYAFDLNDYDYVATGHYAAIVNHEGNYQMKLSIDPAKDQTYFLHQINVNLLPNIIFPLQNITKKDVYKKAIELDLKPIVSKKTSTGLCFIGERNFNTFLQNYLPIKTGSIIDYFSKEMIGNHKGHYFYTIGQTKNLLLHKTHHRYAVIKKDPDKNIIYVVRSEKLPEIKITKFNLVHFNPLVVDIPSKNNCKIRMRHRHKLCSGTLHKENNNYFITGNFAINDVSPGQFAVCYDNSGICLGGGMIDFYPI